MRIPATILAALFVGAAAAPSSVRAQSATTGQEHEQHHPSATAPPAPTTAATQKPMPQMATDAGHMAEMMARMHANDAKLDQLVTRMQTAKGAAKTDAIAELLTALVDDRKNMCEPMMAHMMSMMKAPAPANTRPTTPTTPAK